MAVGPFRSAGFGAVTALMDATGCVLLLEKFAFGGTLEDDSAAVAMEMETPLEDDGCCCRVLELRATAAAELETDAEAGRHRCRTRNGRFDDKCALVGAEQNW